MVMIGLGYDNSL